jgi:hypothetical protein
MAVLNLDRCKTGTGVTSSSPAPQAVARGASAISQARVLARWTSWFEGLQVQGEGKQTIISGPLTDQSPWDGCKVHTCPGGKAIPGSCSRRYPARTRRARLL